MPLTVTKVTCSRSSTMEQMERLLSVWIEEQNEQNIPLSQLVIMEKDKSLKN